MKKTDLEIKRNGRGRGEEMFFMGLTLGRWNAVVAVLCWALAGSYWPTVPKRRGI